jgi:hypothetical protein
VESNAIEYLLIPTQLPCAYRAFKAYKDKPVPKPPYCVYLFSRETFYGSDKKNLIADRDVIVELYTIKKDPVSEKRVEDALSGYEFTKSEEYIDTEGLYQITYEFNHIEKLEKS